jgi:hypothetical protein
MTPAAAMPFTALMEVAAIPSNKVAIGKYNQSVA